MKVTTQMMAALMLCLAAMASWGEPVWIDVRSAQEYAQGHKQGALLMPHGEIEAAIAATDIAKDDTIYLYCRSGRRAGVALQKLEALGYTQVENLGGLQEALRKAGECDDC